MKIVHKLLLTTCFIGLVQTMVGQDDEKYYESLLREEVKVENPVYKPVVGFGIGTLNFYGDVHNRVRNPIIGSPGYKLNVATFIDKKHYFRANFSVMYGTLTANQSSLSDTSMNRNFSSDIVTFGLNLHYSFDNLIKENKNKVKINPFVSLGIENIQFNSKTDLKNGSGQPYHYWNDGTIHQFDQSYAGVNPMIKRDFNYETDLRGLNNGTYSQNTFAIPIEIGVDFSITDRINLRVAQSLHYTFTKNIDNMDWKTGHPNKMNDMFTYSSISLHFDLFSDDKTILVQKLFAEVDNFDYAMYGDEDNDGVYDIFDKCPATPFGVAVDSLGCPYDKDNDGVPDYKDKDLNSRPGAIVDEDGVEIKSEALAEIINVDAITRKEVEAFLLMHKAQSRYKGKPSMPLPGKFKAVDLDGDGYISFDELLKAIDDYFDFSSTLTSKEIYELQDFFFDQ